jgi:hypothetical protein
MSTFSTNTAVGTFLYQGNTTANYSSWTYWQVSYDGWRSTAVFKFDLSSFPAGATINSATLRFRVYSGGHGTTSTDIRFHRILSGNSDWLYTAASWDYRKTAGGNTAWAGSGGCLTAGTDFSSTVLGGRDAIQQNTTYTIDLNTTEVAAMVANNYGILIKKLDPAAANGNNICGTLYETVDYRPYIEIDYTASAVSPSASISPSSSASLSISPSSSTSASISPSSSVSPSVPTLISGTACWGHSTGVTQENTRTFASNWTGSGEITGTGDTERIELNEGEYMESEVVDTSTMMVELDQNFYNSGNDVLLKYRHAATYEDCIAASYSTYTEPFESLGYVQIRIEA